MNGGLLYAKEGPGVAFEALGQLVTTMACVQGSGSVRWWQSGNGLWTSIESIVWLVWFELVRALCE